MICFRNTLLISVSLVFCLISCVHETQDKVAKPLVKAKNKVTNTLVFKGEKKSFAHVKLFNPKATASKDIASDFMTNASALRINAPAMEDGDKYAATVNFHLLSGKPLPAKTYKGELWAKSPDGKGEVRFFVSGQAGGKHYYRQKHFNVGEKWRKLSITETMPKDITSLFLRVDCVAGAKYVFTSPALTVTEKTAVKGEIPQGNLIINGGAERDWYQTGILGRENQIIAGKFIEKHAGAGHKVLLPASKNWVKWSIDKDVKHSGEASFKVMIPKNTNSKADMCFNPIPVGPELSVSDGMGVIPVELGHQLNMTIWAKAKRKTRAAICFFAGSGIAYSKYVMLTTQWKKYQMTVPRWGEAAPGITKHGDTKSGYAMRLGLVQPRVNIYGADNIVWLDDAKCWMGKVAEPNEPDSLYLKGWVIKNPSRYFRRGEAVKLNFMIKNPLNKKRNLKISYSLLDYFGEKFFTDKEFPLEMAPLGEFSRNYEIGPKRNGPMTISFKAEDLDSGKVHTHNYYIGVIGEKSQSYPQLGMDYKPCNADYCVKLLKDFGIGSIRCWSRGMGEDDKFIGHYDLKKFKSAGLYVLYCISKFIPVTTKLYVPTDLGLWLKTVKYNVQLNKGLVDAYEILNEPNIWGGRDTIEDKNEFRYISPVVQTEIIQGCADIVKEIDPAVKIAGPTVAGTNINWIEAVLASGGNKYLDIITEHPYRENPEAPDYCEDLNKLQKVVENFYDHPVPIFATESGHEVAGMPIDNLIGEHSRRSVSWNLRNQISGFAGGLKKYFHFTLNSRHFGTGWSVCWQGNPRNDFKPIPNPCFYAMYWQGHFIGGAKPVGKIELGESLRCFVFRKGAKHVVALWKWSKLEKESVMILKNAEDLEVFDLFGNPSGEKAQGNFKLCLTPNPLYLVTEMPFSELKSIFTAADISGLGLPFQTAVNFETSDKFNLVVSNISNQAINGSCEIIGENVVKNHEPLIFKNMQPNKSITFKLEKSSKEIEILKVRTKVDDGDEFEIKKLNLQVMMTPRLAKKIKIDGDLSDWPVQTPRILTYLDAADNRDTKAVSDWVKTENIKAEVYTAWNKEAVYLAVVVHKKSSYFPDQAPGMWKSDSLQIGFDPLKNPTSKKYGDDDYEYGVALVNGTPTVFCYNKASLVYDGVSRSLGVIHDVKVVISHNNGKTIYEMEFPQSTLSPFKLNADNSMAFNLIVNLNNGEKRMGWLELTPGIGQAPKCTKDFITMFLK